MAEPGHLAPVVFFSGLTSEEQAGLAASLHRRRYFAGETIFLQGDPGTSLYIVGTGRVKIVLPSPEGREFVLAMLGPGDFFGETALFDGGPRSADALAHADCSLSVLLRDDFLRFIEARPKVALKLLAAMSRRMRQNAGLLQDAAFLDVPTRLIRALLHLGQPQVKAGLAGVLVTPRLTQGDLAGMIGATRETVNKCLGAFEREGLIRREGGTIVLLRPDELRARVS